MKWPAVRSAYVHVPFCRHRCGYCNFSVVAGRDDLVTQFLSALEMELAQSGCADRLETLFIGGGTPTHLSIPQLATLFDSIARYLPLSPQAEVTVEANPEDITCDKLEFLRSRGVNRISLGVQSFDERKLRVLDRSHSQTSATLAIEACAKQIGNVSIDLIFAAPDETLEQWQADLELALQLPITHLSTYALTFEKGTRFWTQRAGGTLKPVAEETDLAMYEATIELTGQRGMGHYEISNFARDGFRCRHNLAYWLGQSWLAFGPGAARFVDGVREVNHRSTSSYIKRLLVENRPATAESERLTPQQFACERAAFGIRMRDGVDLDQIHADTGIDVVKLRSREIARCLQRGWLELHQGRHRLTASGVLFADSVAGEFL